MNDPTIFDFIKGFINPKLQKKFAHGKLVVVLKEGGWQKSLCGRVTRGPEPVRTLQGVDYYYWVEFDEPAFDLEDDGPYVEAQILSRYIQNAT